jgi:dihydroorotate dehydrogenase
VPVYRLLFKLLLVRLPEEAAHRLALGALRAVAALPGARALLRRALAPREEVLRVRALGTTFPSPLGLAAGVDSSAAAHEGLALLGFGFLEVGTVTAEGQPGNAGRRVVRLARERAIVNRRGFPNDGAAAVAARLRRRARRVSGPPLAVNIGKSAAAPLAQAAADYRQSLRELAPLADFVVLNVSSPNTPGLRDLQSPERLRELLAAVRDELDGAAEEVPLLIKIAPDLDDAQLDAIVDVALALGLDGIVAVNTTIDRGILAEPQRVPADVSGGGVSGAPLAPRALAVLRRLRARAGEQLTLISVGGIETADDVWQRLAAGATLVESHTGFVYGGPLWPQRVNRELARRLRTAGMSSLEQLIGSEAPAAGARDVTPSAHA